MGAVELVLELREEFGVLEAGRELLSLGRKGKDQRKYVLNFLRGHLEEEPLEEKEEIDVAIYDLLYLYGRGQQRRECGVSISMILTAGE